MSIHVSQAFHRTSANPIDETMALTKAQMLLVNDNIMPQYYLTICQDDGAIYLYDKSATPSVECGKFHKLEAGENYVNNDDLGELVVNVYNPEKSDYAVDDYVIYLKKLYRCKVANTRNLPTNTTDWEKVNIIDTIDKKVNEHVPDLSNYVDNEDLGELIVELYDSTKVDYAVDDYVIYLKKLYRCKVANTRNLPTNTTDWEKVNLISTLNNKLINYLTEADANKLITSNWNSSISYIAGEYVLYGREIYRCKTTTIANEAWDGTKWDKVTLIQPFMGSIPGLVPTAKSGDDYKALTGSGEWKEFVNVHISYDSQEEELHLDFSRTLNTATIGGRTYRTVNIGNQTWLAENLDYKFPGSNVGGDEIDYYDIRSNYYNDDESTYGVNGNKYGLLYDWNAVEYLEQHKTVLIPGWHVPTMAEWNELFTTAGGASAALLKLRARTDWPEDAKGTDDYGFTALPCGTTLVSGNSLLFNYVGFEGYFWTADGIDGAPMAQAVVNMTTSISIQPRPRNFGNSLRLVRDN